MVDFIHNNKDLYGVDGICRILPIAPSTYYRTLDLCENPEHRAKRDLHDLHHAEEIKRIWKESSGRYGVRKVWQKLKREGYIVARCTVAPDLISTLDLKETKVVCADKGYDSEPLREQIRKTGTKANIPKKTNSQSNNDHMDWYLYKIRHLVENMFCRLKQFRGIAT